MTLTGMHISYTSEAYLGSLDVQFTYKHLATIKGNDKKLLTSKNLFVIEIHKNIDQINMFLDRHDYLIKHIEIKVSRRRISLFIYKRKRLGRTDRWFERELESLRD